MSRITSFRTRRRPVALALAVAAVATAAVFAAAHSGQAASTVVPSNTTPPTISGDLKVGSTLTATNGIWTGTPTTFTYQWQRCDENGGSCAAISGTNTSTYVLKQADAGSTLRVAVAAANAEGSAPSSTSVPTGLVGTTQVSGCPTGTGAIKIADLSSPARLQIDQQVTSPALITGSTQQLVAHFRVTACNGRPVEGALVDVQVVPYDQFSGPEGTTAADGTVNVTLNRQKGYPVSTKQQLLVMFVRARKAGEDLLGGISNRRLVSFPVSTAG